MGVESTVSIALLLVVVTATWKLSALLTTVQVNMAKKADVDRLEWKVNRLKDDMGSLWDAFRGMNSKDGG